MKPSPCYLLKIQNSKHLFCNKDSIFSIKIEFLESFLTDGIETEPKYKFIQK